MSVGEIQISDLWSCFIVVLLTCSTLFLFMLSMGSSDKFEHFQFYIKQLPFRIYFPFLFLIAYILLPFLAIILYFPPLENIMLLVQI